MVTLTRGGSMVVTSCVFHVRGFDPQIRKFLVSGYKGGMSGCNGIILVGIFGNSHRVGKVGKYI